MRDAPVKCAVGQVHPAEFCADVPAGCGDAGLQERDRQRCALCQTAGSAQPEYCKNNSVLLIFLRGWGPIWLKDLLQSASRPMPAVSQAARAGVGSPPSTRVCFPSRSVFSTEAAKRKEKCSITSRRLLACRGWAPQVATRPVCIGTLDGLDLAQALGVGRRSNHTFEFRHIRAEFEVLCHQGDLVA